MEYLLTCSLIFLFKNLRIKPSKSTQTKNRMDCTAVKNKIQKGKIKKTSIKRPSGKTSLLLLIKTE